MLDEDTRRYSSFLIQRASLSGVSANVGISVKYHVVKTRSV